MPGFHLIFLPYADDVRTLDAQKFCPSDASQVEKMKEIVQKLRFPYRCHASKQGPPGLTEGGGGFHHLHGNVV